MKQTIKSKIAKTTKAKSTFTGEDALMLLKHTEIQSASAKVKKLLTKAYKEVNPDNKIHTYNKHGVSIQAVKTSAMVWKMEEFIKAYPKFKDIIKDKKFYKKQERVTLEIKKLQTA